MASLGMGNFLNRLMFQLQSPLISAVTIQLRSLNCKEFWNWPKFPGIGRGFGMRGFFPQTAFALEGFLFVFYRNGIVFQDFGVSTYLLRFA
jgi:hypothetical protein